MARLITSGFELNDNGGATSPDGARSSATISQVHVRSGANALLVNAVSQSCQYTFAAVTLGVDVFARTYIYVSTGALPSSVEAEILGLGPGSDLFKISLQTDGTLKLYAFIGAAYAQQGSASAAIKLDEWNMVDLRANIGTGAIDQCEARLAGVSFASASSLTVSDGQITAAFIGNTIGTGSGLTAYFDDVAVNDASGANQNTWPGDGRIVLLVPTADSAVGTGWTLGTGTAIAGNTGKTAVSNKPPLGVADLAVGSDVKQIRNATSNANVNYDATMTTYTAAGLITGDTVKVVIPMIATAAPVTTSAKAGTVGVVSNPAIANVALGAGGTAGAFWSGATAATYVTGWKWSSGTITYSPSVTLGTAPVMRITQVTSSTRIAMVCFMGIYVEYLPAPVSMPAEMITQRRTPRRRLLQRL